jgi:4-amino-4-deoxy-L-arabinose transferase-like glycosyltransferase
MQNPDRVPREQVITFTKWKDSSWIAPVIVFLAALTLFSINLDRPPHADELHHILAAQHLLETGRPILAEGEYTRGILHTWLVAIAYEIFGEGLASARIPSVLLVAVVALTLFLWVRHEARYLAAWLTAALFVSSPFTVEIAQFSRFYALQMFSFVLGALCFYYTLLAAVSPPRRVILGALASGLLILAISSQKTSLVGIAGVALWTFGLVVQRAFISPTTSRAVKKGLVALLIAAGVFAILAATLTDALEWAWNSLRSTQLFNARRQNEFWFYHLRFLLLYPTLWSLVGVVAVFAIVQSRRLAWYAITIFSVSFLVMSFAGPKATRYLSFAPPFLAIVWGVGLAHIGPPMCRYAEATRIRLTETLALPQRVGQIAGNTVLIAALSIIVLANPFWLRTATVIGNVALPLETPITDWREAREALAPWVSDADIMITTEELGAIYFLGRSDVRFSPSKLQELDPEQIKEFGIDYRTGRPIISRPKSLEQLIDCFPRGIVVGPIEHWGDPIRINEAVQEVLEKHARPIAVPKESHLYAWGWEREFAGVRPSYCSDLSRFSRPVDALKDQSY